MQGSIMGIVGGGTRSLDYSSLGFRVYGSGFAWRVMRLSNHLQLEL